MIEKTLGQLQKKYKDKVRRRIRFLNASTTYLPFKNIRKSRWNIIKISRPITKDDYEEIFILAKQSHKIQCGNRKISFTDWAVFTDSLLPEILPFDHYFVTRSAAEKYFKELVK